MLPHPSARRAPRTARRTPFVLSAPIFRSVLIRERKRAERSNRPIVVVFVASPDPHQEPSAGWAAVIERLAAALDATDVMGWYEPGAVLGIVHLVPGDRPLDARVQQDIAGVCSVRVLVHPDPLLAGDEDLRAMDPGLYPELTFPRRSDRLRDAVKRMVDVAGSLLALILLAPLLAVIAALVKLTSPGPALFRQTRVGQHTKPFIVRKFRTMHAHADNAIHRDYVSRFITAGGRDARLSTNGVFKLTNDGRITPLGRFLRKTSLDELPQFWNVLRGDMSLVGPRPPVPYEYAQYRPWHRRRVIEVKPGITGLWQVSGRSRTTFDEMVRLDLRYARTRSFRRDLAIICKTPPAVVSGKGAH
jgi:lipopolysaccharide/colanic/teichoic acid biosynthesis glycosyltransferase